jgi:iron complex transport system substrate-binding protein
MRDEVRLGVLIVIVAALLFAACQRRALNDVVPTTREMREVTDDLGRTITVPVKITRVVSTAPSITEMVFAAGGGDRLVGVTTFCNYPEEAKAIAKIGDTMTPNMETIVALKPDIVLVSTASQLENFTQTLEKNGIGVYVTNPTSLEDVLEELTKLGEFLGTEEQAGNLVRELLRRLEDVAALPRYGEERVFVQISREPLFTIGRESFMTEMIGMAGAVSVTADVETAYPKLSREVASALNPEVIILSDSPDNREPNEALKKSVAVQYGRVYSINADIISRPGPRLVDALEELTRLIQKHRS